MLRENAAPADILVVEATDRDQGVYGQVRVITLSPLCSSCSRSSHYGALSRDYASDANYGPPVALHDENNGRSVLMALSLSLLLC